MKDAVGTSHQAGQNAFNPSKETPWQSMRKRQGGNVAEACGWAY